MSEKFQMVAKTFQGLEDVLRDELITLGAENVEIGTRMVQFEGDNEILYKANLCCRTALRILKPIVKFTAEDTDELYDKVRELEWEEFMNVDSTFSIDSTVNGVEFTHSKYVTYRVKDAIADHFNDRFGKRPSIRLTGADLQLDVHIAANRVTISLDSSGEPLSKRGYRVQTGEAPINEVLAAGIILKTGWRGDSDFVDPMCGSGTFLIEAALIAANINPGIYRENFAFERWPDFDRELFEEIYEDDSKERDFTYTIYGGDINPERIADTKKNIHNAHVEDMIKVTCKPFSEWTDNAPEGVLVTNPPYGERLKPENINTLYKSIGSTLKNYFKGWHAWIIASEDAHFADIGLKPSVKIPLFNGGLECSLQEYVMFDGTYSQFRADGGSVANNEARRERQGPKKVKHISEDDWKKESNKFSGPKKHNSERRKDGKSFSRNDRKNIEEEGFRRDDKKEKKDFQRDNRGDNRDFSRNSGRSGDFNRDDKGNRDFRRDDRRNGDFRRDDRRNGDFRRDDKGNRDFRRDDKRNGDFRRDDRKNGEGRRDDRRREAPKKFTRESSYNPDNSRGPRISADKEHLINPVHMRQRKRRNFEEEED